MPGKPCNKIINWNEKSLGIFRQVYRVAADEKFRNHELDVYPDPEEIIKKYNVTTDDDWSTFKFDLLGNKGIEMNRGYACYLIQYLIDKMQLPMKNEWYAKSFVQNWERKPASQLSKEKL